MSAEFRERLVVHEAGHLLVGYCMGLPVAGYQANDSILNAVQVRFSLAAPFSHALSLSLFLRRCIPLAILPLSPLPSVPPRLRRLSPLRAGGVRVRVEARAWRLYEICDTLQ